ncbi:hypothetical protein CSE16_06095 [Solibacillus sp. R5-41]|nr:hypothetical protein CSE16_06095 [Solibacillus sp. R5-41]
MNSSPRVDRQKRIQFAVGMAAIDGGKPTTFTQNLLNQYEDGEISAIHFKQAIIEKYAKGSRK